MGLGTHVGIGLGSGPDIGVGSGPDIGVGTHRGSSRGYSSGRARKGAGTLMLDDTDIRKPAPKRDGGNIIGDDQPAKKSRDTSRKLRWRGCSPRRRVDQIPSGVSSPMHVDQDDARPKN